MVFRKKTCPKALSLDALRLLRPQVSLLLVYIAARRYIHHCYCPGFLQDCENDAVLSDPEPAKSLEVAGKTLNGLVFLWIFQVRQFLKFFSYALSCLRCQAVIILLRG